MKIAVITPVYNAREWIGLNMVSIKKQQSDLVQIIIDDCSTDGTSDVIEKHKDGRHIVIRNETRLLAPQSHYIAMQNVPKDCDIVAHIDGDDWLLNPQSLKVIEYVYEQHKCHGTFGNYVATNGERSVCRLPNEGTFRDQIKFGWPFSHIRTFKRKYIDHFKEEYLKDDEGKWLTRAGDVGVITPIFEMIGQGKIVFVDEKLLAYNRINPINEDKVDVMDQIRCAKIIIDKQPLSPLND